MTVALPAGTGGRAGDLAAQSPGARGEGEPAGRLVRAAGLRWHVQRTGRGPVLLLLHGTGASTHSWRALMPRLAARFTVVAPDLPGHGASEAPPTSRHSLPVFAEGVAGLLDALELRPDVVVGHSAGAAIACRMALDGAIAPDRIVGLNAAMRPMGGPLAPLATRLARPLFRAALVPRLLAVRGRDAEVVERLIRGTGSRLDAPGVAAYGRLFQNPSHVAATLRMMAHWDLRPLARELPRLATPLQLVAADRDRYVSIADAERIAASCPLAHVEVLSGLGHLAHEESPARVAELVERPFPTGAGRAGPRREP